MSLLPPLFLQNGTYSAATVRSLVTLLGTEGVVDSGYAVTERGAGANMSVDVAAGYAFVEGDDEAGQGRYLCVSTATRNVTLNAADPSNPRIDIICVTVRDSEAGGAAGDDFVVEVITGTPSGVPSAPATPDSAIKIAEVDVAAAATSILNADITDTRAYAKATLATNLNDLADVDAPSPDDGDQLVFDSASGLWLPVPSGRIVQVQSTFLGTTFTGTSNNTWIDITGLAVTITPKSASNTILVMGYTMPSTVGQYLGQFVRVVRELSGVTTEITATTGGPGTSGLMWNTRLDNYGWNVSWQLVDSPATTSAVTYKGQVNASTTANIGRANAASSSSIVAMEIRA